MSNKKKITIICLIIVFLLIIGFSIFLSKPNENILETYILNQQGLMKNEKVILDERFDEKGNLIYYKYKSIDNNDISEFNFKYKYDNYDRITEVSLNNEEQVKIEYDKNNRISNINENISNSLSNNTDFIQFSFNYLSDDEIKVDKNITNSKGTENEFTQNYTLTYKNTNYNNKKCILLTEKDDKGKIILEILYEKNEQKMNYTNFYELLNIIPLGYATEDNSFKYTNVYNNSLLLMYPVIFNGDIIYSNQYYNNMNMKSNKYYDNSNKLLKQSTTGYETNQITNCMYKSINPKEYYEYRLVKNYSNSSAEFTYIQNKIYLDDNDNIYKKETLKSDKIDENEYNSKLKEFEQYFEKENS